MFNRRKQGLDAAISFWTIIAFVFAMTLMLVVAWLFNSQNQTIRYRIEEQFNDQVQAQELERTSRTLVSSYRGYVAYGLPDYLDTFYTDVEAFIARLDQLRSSLVERRGEDTRITASVTYIQSSWRDMAGSMQEVIELKKQSGNTNMKSVSDMKVTPYVNSINSRFGELVQLQEEQVQSLLGKNRDTGNLLLLVPFALIILIGIMGYVLVYYLRKNVVQPVLYLNVAVSQIAEGEYVEVRTSERRDELGSLQRGVRRMSTELARREAELETFNKELIKQRDLLEAQNEEITAQQEEQHETLRKLTARERELELITTYQEKLSGYLDMSQFLEETLPVLLQVVNADAAAVVMLETAGDEGKTKLVYSTGYPGSALQGSTVDLYGPASRVLSEGRTLSKVRRTDGAEQGVHHYYKEALDQYIPLTGSDQRVYGFLLLTTYGGQGLQDEPRNLNKGVFNQFSLALHAKVLNEERLQQAALLERLHGELLKEKLVIQNQRDFTRQVNESIQEGMLICSSDGQILFANSRMEGYFGYTANPGDSIGDFCNRINSRNSGTPVTLRESLEKLLKDGGHDGHERFVVEWPDGIRHYEMYANAVENTTLPGISYLLVFRDRTDEEKADEIKNEFVSIVSHELRTPLSSILGFIEILLNRKVAPEKQQRYLATIHSEAIRLSSLINDFLDLQRMENGKQVYQPVPCGLGELVSLVAEQWEDKSGHELHLTCGPGELVACVDVDRIKQVLHNLISNAVKYSPGSDRVDITCSRDGEAIRMDITDYGLGIPESAKDKLFTKFYRVDNSDRRQIGGTGLGLAIVKEIVEAHGGRLSFESVLGEGSTFTVWLPTYEAQDVGGKIVIVEDDPNLASMLAVSFEKLHNPTVCLSSAEEAIYALRHSVGSPVICIVDIQLKGVQSGWEFIAELLKHPVHHEAPVIVTTVLEQPNHFHETRKERYLQKPFTVERMLELVELLVSQNQAGAPFVFPVQDERLLADSLQNQGIAIRDIKVNTDFIEVNIDKDDNDRK